jgi:hypothetical protein
LRRSRRGETRLTRSGCVKTKPYGEVRRVSTATRAARSGCASALVRGASSAPLPSARCRNAASATAGQRVIATATLPSAVSPVARSSALRRCSGGLVSPTQGQHASVVELARSTSSSGPPWTIVVAKAGESHAAIAIARLGHQRGRRADARSQCRARAGRLHLHKQTATFNLAGRG